MTQENGKTYKTMFIRWLICFSVVGGYMLYHTVAPSGTILLAGVATLLLMLLFARHEIHPLRKE